MDSFRIDLQLAISRPMHQRTHASTSQVEDILSLCHSRPRSRGSLFSPGRPFIVLYIFFIASELIT